MSPVIVAIHQPQYLPYLGFFHKLAQCDVFVVLDDVQFQKNGLQNRNKIKTCKGWQWLTVPVLQRADQTIKEVRLNPQTRWSRKHWSALVTNYSKAPFFALYGASIREILQAEHEYLGSLDMALVRFCAQALGIETPMTMSSELKVGPGKTQRLVNICQALNADTYLSGPGGKRYMEMELFERAGLTVKFQEFTSPVYAQQFADQGFLPNLSVLDALFCCGPEARALIGLDA